MTTHRIAVAGVGNAAGTHMRAYEQLDDAAVVACAGREESRVRSFADEHGCDPFLDVPGMLDAVEPDVLDICTPSGAHLDPALAAADRGVDVFCEKPLEITTERIDRMIDAADEAGIRLGGVFQRRYKPVVRTVREAVAEGRFGPLAVASAALPWWRDDGYYDGTWQAEPDVAGGGAVMNQAIHSVDAVQWIVGAGMDLAPDANPVAEVSAFTGVRGHDAGLDVEDTAVATLRYRDGTLGQLLATTATYPGGEIRYELGGRDGSAEVRGEELAAWQFREEREADAAVRERFSGPDAGADEPSPLELPNVREFLDARASGDPFMLDGSEARKAVAIVEGVYESAERGEPVAVE
ncbi:Gfo/Idh/MocA family protein [Halosimplex halophilum]|uniref:Gfo/Idh/MocA family protein n=1 Tax=Halosimplex halophilum TaxID=2559572 RepID=UPI00107FCD99|nr:Gfo/Idh/MocA family oxidoreductase [Halosimplex halophilum]